MTYVLAVECFFGVQCPKAKKSQLVDPQLEEIGHCTSCSSSGTPQLKYNTLVHVVFSLRLFGWEDVDLRSRLLILVRLEFDGPDAHCVLCIMCIGRRG